MFDAIFGKKQEMSVRFNQDGNIMPATIISAGPCIVARIKSKEKDGYEAVQIGYLKEKKPTKSKVSQFKDLPYIPKHLREVKDINGQDIKVGDEIKVDIFEPGDLIKVTGVSKGKGFAGVVKRWGFAGGPKTHGQSDRHRAPGSIGATTTPGRVLKGKKMAGRMGTDTVTIKNLKVLEVNPDKNILVVSGSVPGHRNSLVLIKKLGKDSKFVPVYQPESAAKEDKSQDKDLQYPTEDKKETDEENKSENTTTANA